MRFWQFMQIKKLVNPVVDGGSDKTDPRKIRVNTKQGTERRREIEEEDSR